MERLSPHELYSLTSVTVYSVKKDSCAAWKLSEKKGVSRFPHIGGTRYLQLFVLIPWLGSCFCQIVFPFALILYQVYISNGQLGVGIAMVPRYIDDVYTILCTR